MTEEKKYTLSPARYAAKSVALRPLDSNDGVKGRTSRLADALNGRWSSREGAYIMSESKGRKFEALYAAGADARLVFDSVHSAHYEVES